MENELNLEKLKKEEEIKNILDSEEEKENEWFKKIKKNNIENEDTFYKTGYNSNQKIKSASSSTSKQSTKTNKTINKQNLTINKNNPAYIYLKEIERYKKKRNHTARMNKKKLILPNAIKSNSPWNNPIKTDINDNNIIQKNRNLNWKNFFIDSKFKTEFGVKGYINVPIIDTRKKNYDTFYESNINKGKKKNFEINYNKDIYKKENKEKKNIINDCYKNNENENLFNTNQKNFFKFRKDIIEEPENEEEDSNDDLQNNIYNTKNEKKNKLSNNKNKNEKKNSIHFPEIYKYFLKFS